MEKKEFNKGQINIAMDRMMQIIAEQEEIITKLDATLEIFLLKEQINPAFPEEKTPEMSPFAMEIYDIGDRLQHNNKSLLNIIERIDL